MRLAIIPCALAAWALVFLFVRGVEVILTPPTCDTDAQCAATWQCRIMPGCDGGPDTQPWRPFP